MVVPNSYAAKDLTRWFPIGMLPTRAGVYELVTPQGRHWWSLFDGSHWRGYWSTPQRAAETGNLPSPMYEEDKWRGLAYDPFATGLHREQPRLIA